jgi:hypothetical protein
MIFSSGLSSLALLTVGPSYIFGFPDSLRLMIVGQLILGLFMPFTLIPGLPEMTDSALVHYKKSQHERVNNLACGLYNTVLGVGEVAGPLYGTFVAA